MTGARVEGGARIGIDLGGSKIEAIALEGPAERVRTRIATPRAYEAALDTLVTLVEDLERRVDARASVGVGIPGAISPSTGLVKNANSTWLNGRAFPADLGSRLGRQVRVANDANCLAVSEATDGAGAGAHVVFGVIVGTGTGGGLSVGGRVVTGPNAVAGEWGHNPLPWPDADEWPGPSCYCGKQGCIETYLSGPGLAAEYARRTGKTLAAHDIAALAARGDRHADDALSRYESRMARALASVVNILDPDVIVLGGGVSNIERLYTRVPALWEAYVFGHHATTGREPVRTRLVRAAHGDASGVRGAAWLWPPSDPGHVEA